MFDLPPDVSATTAATIFSVFHASSPGRMDHSITARITFIHMTPVGREGLQTYIHEFCSEYNLEICLTKSKVMEFCGTHAQSGKICIGNQSVLPIQAIFYTELKINTRIKTNTCSLIFVVDSVITTFRAKKLNML